MAYQLALQARKSGHGSSTLPESFDSKPSKPVPKPRVNIRKSVSPPCRATVGRETPFNVSIFPLRSIQDEFAHIHHHLLNSKSVCLLFTLESFHIRQPSVLIGPPSFILALHRCHQVSVWWSGIILEYLVDVCLGPATVWRRCRLIFDLLSVCTVCCPPSLLHGALIDEARFAELWGSSFGTLLWVCACVCVCL